MYVRNGELIHGVVDKAQYGKYGLVHSVQELYGADTMAHLMSYSAGCTPNSCSLVSPAALTTCHWTTRARGAGRRPCCSRQTT